MAVYVPVTEIRNSPDGEPIGIISRGRVIEVLENEDLWLHFRTWDYPSAWIRLEAVCSLEQWIIRPPFETVSRDIIRWESEIKIIDRNVETALKKILNIQNEAAAGKIPINTSIARIEKERRIIEDSFRAMHEMEHPDVLVTAVESLEKKRWKIDQGLRYLMEYLKTGDQSIGDKARLCFANAENETYQYARILSRIKSVFRLYEENN